MASMMGGGGGFFSRRRHGWSTGRPADGWSAFGCAPDCGTGLRPPPDLSVPRHLPSGQCPVASGSVRAGGGRLSVCGTRVGVAMRMPPRIGDREKRAFLRARLAQHLFDEQVGRNRPRVMTAERKRAIVASVRRPPPKPPPKRVRLSSADRYAMARLIARGTPMKDVAARYGVKSTTVRRVRVEYGIEPPPHRRGNWMFQDGAWVTRPPSMDEPVLSPPAAL